MLERAVTGVWLSPRGGKLPGTTGEALIALRHQYCLGTKLMVEVGGRSRGPRWMVGVGILFYSFPVTPYAGLKTTLGEFDSCQIINLFPTSYMTPTS